MALSDNWDAFARQNCAVGLAPGEVLGRSLWDYIKDETTRRLYQVLLRAVRSKGLSLSFPYRCDSPRMRRYMMMHLTPRADGSVTFVNELVETRARSPEVYFRSVLAPNTQYFVMCSVCNRVRFYETDNWQEVEEAFTTLAQVDDPLEVVYEVCESCSGSLRQTLQQYAPQSIAL